MSARGTASRFLQSVLHNGVGRYVCQLKRVSIWFCRKNPASRGAREFIEEGVVDYARKNPGTVVYVSPQTSGVPRITAEYLNGSVKEVPIDNKTPQQIGDLVTKLTDQSGLDIIRIRKPFHTDSPSIQGQWHPFTNRPPSLGPITPH